ncbi:GVIN1 GTPase, partial [Amia calva]|nr:GVIN1 GTPase [Amia calva]
MNLLQKLGLRNSYPKKLRKTDVLVIDILSQNAKSPTKEEQLRFHYLYKLMMLDYSARNLFIKAQITKSDGQCMEDQILPDDEDSADDDFFNTDEDCNENVRFQESHIHPMDIHMAVFHCANDFLKQYLFSKLSTCQFGLPLLVPNPCTGEVEFPLWALRQIKKSWQHNQQSETGSTVKYNSKEMFNTPVPIVSFIRLGSSVTSKSQILNNVISKKKHSVFFHRHCRGSTEHCLLMDGVVEIAWYCPGGKDDVFDDCVAFMNLHGDASKHPKQLTFLQQVSTVNVALLSENPLDEEARKTSETLSKSPVPFICLFAGKEKVARGKNPTKVRLGAKNRNEAELTDEIISAIKHCVSTNEKTSSLKTYLEAARDQQFRVDEDNEACRQGKGMAQTLLCLLKEEKVSRLKEKFLPLQGELWHSWCRKDKEQYRLESKAKRSIEQQLSDIRAQKLSIRHQQIQKASPINDLIRSFLECLASPEHSQDAKLYMLQWLRIYLDELLTDTLTDLQEKYHSVWTELRKKQKNKDDFNHLQEDLNKISEDLNSTTFGFQHFMREIGQVYEAVQTVPEKLKDRRHHIDNLPAIGAEMLISGYPLELMDGDTAHVPLVWIEAVLEKLKKKTGNKRVFVLSVLGVQSSGKSTLLNTMFGLQFTVSAGRCTRGAFMQLVRVDEEVREQLQYDYVLVVDTEGLRSPELSTKTTLCHDNELATLIIGIGDMTLINIMGENPSEMQDILQICVQAFLRMKSVKIKPSCIFVHQNVAESSANDKNMEGRRRLQERLDEMTQIAAKEEHCDSTGFSDVIQFDVESQVFYFKNLLEGDPPMAPPNPSYSQNVQDLKTKLLSIAQWQRDFKAPTLSELKLRIHDLWNALLGENFVFSFRNTLEIMVYSKLEESYGQWRWKLRKHALEVQKTLHNQIMSKKIQDVNQSELNKDFDKVYNPLKTEIEKYFKEQKYPELLIKWKVGIEKRFEVLNKDLIAETVDQCKVLISLKQSQADLDNRKLEYEAQLLSMSKALASTLKEQMLTDEKVRQEFDKLWVEWVAKVSSEKPPEKDADIKSAVDNILLQTFSTIADNSNQIANKKTHFKFNKTKHIDQSWKQWARSTWNKFTHKEPPLETIGTELTKRIFTKVSEYIDEKQEEKMGFNENFIHQILDQIKSEISESEKSLQYIQFTVQYRFEISVHLCTSAITRFEKMHAAFMRANDPLTYLKSKRDQYLDIFKNFCEGASSITFFVDFLCKQLEPLIQQEAYDKVFIGIIGEMKSNNKMFNGNRSNLENHILKQLAEKKDFDLYMEYINHPKEYFAKFISEQVEEFCRDRKKISGMLNEKQTDLIECILNLSKTVTTAVMEKKGKASMWLDEFCREINIGLSRDDLKNIEREDIADLGFLKDMMAKSLREMLENVKKENSRKPQFDLKMFSKDPAVQLGLIFEGCWEQCPFCKAVCTNTVADHPDDHSVQFHRPEALAGWHYLFSGEFSIDFCTSSVISDGSFIPAEKSLFQSVPFKKYKDAGPPYNKWKITGDNSAKNYWKWFIHTFRSQLEGRFKLKFVGKGTIPNDWKTITEADVMEELG